ncbi:MAG TPA: UDP-N-acetylmuramate dehydrogenase [Acidimicrobiia bacterium]|nr:UDP-N-acetylmuramate dehydrogenase [Acidimicrobiia bacterium]
MTTVASLIAQGFLEENVPLGPLTTYKAGGPARLVATLETRTQVEQLTATGLAGELPVLVLGRGSNLVVSDRGFDGLVVRLGGDFSQIAVDGLTVTAGAAAPLPKVARASVAAGVGGLEFLVGVPGSVGGAIRQNAGCFGSETVDFLASVEIAELAGGAIAEYPASDLDLSYRKSNVGSTQLVLSAVFQGVEGDPRQGSDLMREITRWRKDNQPGGTFNAGSVFKNPPGSTAGEIIDSLGLKGLAVGDVSVSEKHANFFVAGPGASSDDIHELVSRVKAAVFEATGTNLEPEIQFVGFEE